MMYFFQTVVPVLCTAISALSVALIIPMARSYAQHVRRRASLTIIGVVSGSQIPECLRSLRDYTNISKIYHSADTYCILHTRTLSYALRKCDFVIADDHGDPKIFSVDDPFWEDLANEAKSIKGISVE